jgi:hypothetical protein
MKDSSIMTLRYADFMFRYSEEKGSRSRLGRNFNTLASRWCGEADGQAGYSPRFRT